MAKKRTTCGNAGKASNEAARARWNALNEAFFSDEVYEAIREVWRKIDATALAKDLKIYHMSKQLAANHAEHYLLVRGETAIRLLRLSNKEGRRRKAQRSKRKANSETKAAQARAMFAAIPEKDRRGRLTTIHKRIATELECSPRTIRSYLNGND